MKDQRALATKCLKNDIPFFTLCGNDINALPILQLYYKSAQINGSSEDFLDDLSELILDFKAYQVSEPENMKIPD